MYVDVLPNWEEGHDLVAIYGHGPVTGAGDIIAAASG